MTPHQLFPWLNLIALLSWVALAADVRRRWVAPFVTTVWVPLLFAAVYTVIVATTWWSSEGSFSTLAGVSRLFAQPWILLAGWVHYLAFDLIIGSWEVMDARDRHVPHLLVLPCLALTFMFGPVGWLAYRALRRWRGAANGASGSRV